MQLTETKTNSRKIVSTLIIPVFQEANILSIFLESLSNTVLTETKIIFINDGAGNSIQGMLEQFAKTCTKSVTVQIVCHVYPHGSGASINEVLNLTEGEFVIILDSDLILQKDWHLEMLSTFHLNEEIGVIGGLLLFPQTGGVQHCGVGFSSDVARHLYLNANPENVPIEKFMVQCVIFALCGIRKKAIDTVGQLDEGYFNSYDDFDFQMRIRDAGYGILLNPKIRAYHWQKSNGVHREFNRRNNLGRFWRKWGTKIQPDIWDHLSARIKLFFGKSNNPSEFIGIDLAEIRNDASEFWLQMKAHSQIKLKEIRDYSHNATKSGELWLPSITPPDLFLLPYRFLFLVDNFIFLTDNYYWHSMRKTIRNDDLIMDLYGNVVLFSNLSKAFWPGSKVRL